METLSIKRKKSMLIYSIIVSILFSGICIMAFFDGELKVFLGLPVFLYLFYISVKKIIDKKPALIITNEGITDYSSVLRIGFIPWHEMNDVFIKKKRLSVSFLFIEVKNPEKIVEKQSILQKILIYTADKTYLQYPVRISSSSIKYDLKDLEKIITDHIQKTSSSE